MGDFIASATGTYSVLISALTSPQPLRPPNQHHSVAALLVGQTELFWGFGDSPSWLHSIETDRRQISSRAQADVNPGLPLQRVRHEA